MWQTSFFLKHNALFCADLVSSQTALPSFSFELEAPYYIGGKQVSSIEKIPPVGSELNIQFSI
tara:strand:- start:561 stop:749 length:189 start_codon:yes stop_codon:yes gene_type:complete